ncbi:MAG: hypothetical protein CVT73_10925 [Alphaproteobacteria bacterium HGW-Alphaproteobacteria-12]|nr:MAG: hypothetical protein CVT73_10925 [Alphaproteobacteria bacterium HGW-Alphaproteobacteria-12]
MKKRCGRCFPFSSRISNISAIHFDKIMSSIKKILIVDDDDALRGSLVEQLQLHESFSCLAVASAAAGLEHARSSHVDLVLLDVGLPDMDGREACRLMRKAGVKVPIIMLTGADTDSDTILGLDAGANDYVTKPFRFGVLLARIRAHLRSHENSDDAVFKIGPYSFRPGAKMLLDTEEKKIRLTEKDLAVVPTRSIPECLSALVAFDPDSEMDQNRAQMSEAIEGVRSGAVTRAVRDSKYKGSKIREGDFIGLFKGSIVTAGTELPEVTLKLVERMAEKGADVVTLIRGEAVAEDAGSDIESRLREIYGGDLEVLIGNQPLYHYLVGIE